MVYEFPLLPAAPYLKYDAGDVPAVLGGLLMGPWAGVVVQVLKNALFAISGKNETGLIGLAANFTAGVGLVVPAALIYRRLGGGVRAALVALVAGTISMTALMAMANAWVFFPLWGIRAGVLDLLVRVAIPFNLLKGVLTSLFSLLLYPRVRLLFER
jgi:riboflavin transporter FmnP